MSLVMVMLNHVLKVSLMFLMDGPNVYWKLLNMIKQDCCDKNPQGLKTLGIGSCGFHVIHGACGMVESATDWSS